MEKGKMLNTMLVLATNRHAGQYDRGQNPYILHPLKVMYYTKSDDEEIQCIALGHDLLEDTDTTIKELRELGFTERVIQGILALTKMPGQDQDTYVSLIKQNQDAIKVKLADLRHNSDIRRLKGVGRKDVERIVKYQNMHAELTEALRTFKEGGK
jgi:(p)ppGpp synthase/HD superfamily hydrolase